MKIAFVNPPGRQRYLRDYYCASIAKSDYYYPPIDFVWLSAQTAFTLRIFDAIVNRLAVDSLITQLRDYNPDYLVCLISELSLAEDLAFLQAAKINLTARIIVTGDICRASPQELLSRCADSDAILTSFAVLGLDQVLSEGIVDRPLPEGWVNRKTPVTRDSAKEPPGEISIGVPKWDLFDLRAYQFPIARNQPAATVLTDFGCVFSCAFCPVGGLSWRTRVIAEVLDELRLLKKLGIREIHFRDQTFGVDKARTALLLEELSRFNIGWSCFCKADLFTEESARAYKRAGCHTVIFGIESGVARMREEYGKRLKDSDIKSALHICSRNRIDTAGTFIIGLPGETDADLSQTIAFARSLPLDYASFNIAAPRLGTKLRAGQDFVSARFPEHERLQQSVDLANRSFYLRPAYIGRRLAKVTSPAALLRQARVGLRLLRGR